MSVVTAEIGPWRFVWHGGRTADIYHLEASSSLDCMQVCAFESNGPFAEPTLGEPFTVATLEARAVRWVADHEAEYIEHHLPYAEA